MRVRSETDREILRLAVPAFLALVAEPLFLLGDAAVVGHLGTAELAGVGIAVAIAAYQRLVVARESEQRIPAAHD